jgi:hypothetical protein
MLQPETYGQELARLVAKMKSKSGALEKYGRSLEMRQMKKSLDALRGLGEKTHGGVQQLLRGKYVQLKKLEEVNLRLENNTAQVGDVRKTVEQEGAAIMTRLGDLERRIEQLSRLSAANVVQTLFDLISQDPPQGRVEGRGGRVEDRRVSRSGVAQKLTGTTANSTTTAVLLPAAPRPAPRPTQRTRRQAQAAEPRLDAAAVLATVGFNADLTPLDGRNILRAARLSARDDQLVAEITSHVRLQALVEVPSSAVLFIEGGPDRRHEARGPISVAAARVVAALARGRETNPSLYALAYFCSEHPSWRDGLGGTAMALVITLLLQLVDQHRDFDTALLRECHDAVTEAPREPTEDDVRGCCDLLQRCVLALPEEATLFCVVEGIAFFEGPRKRTEHTRLILQRLLELGNDGLEGRARIKCLFTTPARSPKFNELFRPYDVLTVQATNSSGFFRRNSWIMGERR